MTEVKDFHGSSINTVEQRIKDFLKENPKYSVRNQAPILFNGIWYETFVIFNVAD